MAKFHINKHGVPAPCKAKTGNCPLGGEDSHFATQADAQAFVDKQNASTHGLLPSTQKEVPRYKVSQEAFDEVFIEPYDGGGGFLLCGVDSMHFGGMGIDEDSVNEPAEDEYDAAMKELYKAIPKEYTDYEGENVFVMIREENVATHISSYMLHMELEETHSMNLTTVAEYAPEEVEFDGEEPYDFSDELKEDIGRFTAEKMVQNPAFYINDTKIIVDYPNEPRNFAEDYFKSGAYEEFKKNKR